MKVLIVFDSYFGNTEKIAKSIGEKLRTDHDVKIVHIDKFAGTDLAKTDLLIVGSPTRAFSPTKKITKSLKRLDLNTNGKLRVAVFDTRMDIAKVNVKILTFLTRLKGYATDSMLKILEKRGLPTIGESMGFIVTESEGPLQEGEIERAEHWADELSAM